MSIVSRNLQCIANIACSRVDAAAAHHPVGGRDHRVLVTIAICVCGVVRRGVEAIACRIGLDLRAACLAHVPNACVVAPHRRVGGGLRLGRIAPVHRDLGAVGEGRNPHPDVGIAAWVPRVDFAFEDVVPLRVRREPHVRASVPVFALKVAERVAVLAKTYQSLKVRQRFRPGVARALERDGLRRGRQAEELGRSVHRVVVGLYAIRRKNAVVHAHLVVFPDKRIAAVAEPADPETVVVGRGKRVCYRPLVHLHAIDIRLHRRTFKRHAVVGPAVDKTFDPCGRLERSESGVFA